MEYNAIGGKYQRGLTVLIAFQELVEPKKQDAESLGRALTVGWCVELVRGMGERQEKQRSYQAWGCPGGKGRRELETNFSMCFWALVVKFRQ